MRPSSIALLALSACGVPDNAVLEVRLELPQQFDEEGKERAFAQVAVVADEVRFDAREKVTVDSQTFALKKRDDADCNVTLSIVAEDPRKDRARIEGANGEGLSILIWFCPTPKVCDSRNAPRWRLDFDKALWPKERTFFEAAAPGSTCSRWGVASSTLPSVQKPGPDEDEVDFSLRIGQCAVLGCLDEASQPAQDVGFCDDDGVHPCE